MVHHSGWLMYALHAGCTLAVLLVEHLHYVLYEKVDKTQRRMPPLAMNVVYHTTALTCSSLTNKKHYPSWTKPVTVQTMAGQCVESVFLTSCQSQHNT
jgi:hypothetical protein